MTSSTADRVSAAPAIRRRGTFSPRAVLAVLALLCLGCMLAALAIGRYPVPVSEVLRILLSPLIDLEQTWYDSEYAAVMDIRLPRVLVSCIVGASLALTGATMQAVFQNPLASSQMLVDESRRARLLVATMDPFYHHGSGFMPGATQLLHAVLQWATRPGSRREIS